MNLIRRLVFGEAKKIYEGGEADQRPRRGR
jgi:hypothetical protein